MADDYYEADKRRSELKDYYVSQPLAEKLAPVKKVVDAKPKEVPTVDWLEALGSLAYMSNVQRREKAGLVAECESHKPHLKKVLPSAFKQLDSNGLIA